MAAEAFLPAFAQRHRLTRLPRRGVAWVGRRVGHAVRSVLLGVLRDLLALLWAAWLAGAAGIYALLALGHA